MVQTWISTTHTQLNITTPENILLYKLRISSTVYISLTQFDFVCAFEKSYILYRTPKYTMGTNHSTQAADRELPKSTRKRPFHLEICRKAIPFWNYPHRPKEQELPIYDKVEHLLFATGGS
jgi:hypothetical protein